MKNMSKSARIALGIVCFILMLGLGFAIFYLVDTPKFNQLFGIAQEQPVDPDTPVDPNTPVDPELEEITDYIFVNNTVLSYVGDSSVVENIPTSYSIKEDINHTKHFSSFNELAEYVDDLASSDLENFVEIYSKTLNIIPDNGKDAVKVPGGILYFSYDEDVFNSVMASDTFPASVEIYDTTYYEGNDYQLDTLGEYFPESVEKIVVPVNIQNISRYTFNLPNLQEVIIENDESVLVCIDGQLDPSDIRYYVPDNLYDDYKNNSAFPSNQIYKLSQYGQEPEITYSDFIFSGNTLVSYIGSDKVVTIPSSYSIDGENLKTCVELETSSDVEEKLLSFEYISFEDLTHLPVGVVINDKETRYDNTYTWLMEFVSNQDYESSFPITLNIYAPVCVEGNDVQVTNISSDVFQANVQIEEVVIPEGITSIGSGSFQYCSSLRKVTLPGTLKSLTLNVFADCPVLEEVVFAEGFERIGNDSFARCENLKKIVLPSTFQGVGKFELTLNDTCQIICDFEGVNQNLSQLLDNENMALYVPSSMYDQYIEFYSNYTSQIYVLNEEVV